MQCGSTKLLLKKESLHAVVWCLPPNPATCNTPCPSPAPQRPAALHICITAAHSSGIIELLLRDLQEAVATALQVRYSTANCPQRRAAGCASRSPRLRGSPCCSQGVRLKASPLLHRPQDPSAGGDGTAPLYGMAAVVPDRRIVAQFLTAYQDALLEGI